MQGKMIHENSEYHYKFHNALVQFVIIEIDCFKRF